MLFASLLASKWRWPAAALALVVVVYFGAQLCDYAASWWGHRQAVKAAEATVQAHDNRAAAEVHQQHHFDSLLFTRIGESRELARARAKIKHLDDSLNHRLPAAPALPADPPRQ